ncbi:hypothetical protein RJ640_015011, partial [Escallonia rubra]
RDVPHSHSKILHPHPAILPLHLILHPKNPDSYSPARSILAPSPTSLRTHHPLNHPSGPLCPGKRDPHRYPLEKFFFPPETDVSSLTTLLSTRLILKGSNILLSKYARDAQAEFVKSSVRTEDCPADGLPEIALVSRSTVGKSSLLNSLCGRLVGAALGKGRIIPYLKKPWKKPWAQAGVLLRTTPMRIEDTIINHFRINDSWFLVDFLD